MIGNGPAGFRFCDRLTALAPDRTHRLTVFGEESRPAYDRVRLTEYLRGRSADSLESAPPDWYAEQGIALHTGDPVLSIDREARLVRSAGGRTIPFDRLVLATGSRAHLPSVPGIRLPGVFVYRTLDDLARIRERSRHIRRAAVIGGGLLGLEAATALRSLGLDTWVVERGITLLARQLGPHAGDLLRNHMERLGVRVVVSREIERIESVGPDLLAEFTNGECLRVQMLVFAVGIRPRDELGAECGLRIGPRGGIAIDDALATSDPRIHAIGECAAHDGHVYGLAGPALTMAEILADRFRGKDRRFRGADVSAWLKVPGISVASLGDHQANCETLVSHSNGAYRSILIDRGRLIGAVGVGEWPEQSRVHAAILQRSRVWRWQRARFLRTGQIWLRAPRRPVAEWPATAIVCNCRGVSRGALTNACAGGCATVAQLARSTGASTVCGSCAPLLAELTGNPAVPSLVPGARILGWASAAAAGLAALIFLAPPIPFLETAQNPWSIDHLWRGTTFRQVSGFALVALVLAGLGLSARKRIPRFQAASVGTWRAIHAVLGTLSLLTLVAHTGFRLGYNLNRVLMLDFLALAIVGSLAGLVTALESRWGGALGRTLRSAWTTLHLFLTWPFPVLVIFHVFTSYYF